MVCVVAFSPAPYESLTVGWHFQVQIDEISEIMENSRISPSAIKELWQRHKTIGDDNLQDFECPVWIDLEDS
jgi:hypothetical protein